MRLRKTSPFQYSEDPAFKVSLEDLFLLLASWDITTHRISGGNKVVCCPFPNFIPQTLLVHSVLDILQLLIVRFNWLLGKLRYFQLVL